MHRLSGLLKPVTHPVIDTRRDLRGYVLLVTVIAIVLALSLDVASQLAFFTDWGTALRSWALTVVDAAVVAVPISLLVGRSQRDLRHAKRTVEELSLTDALTGLPNRRAIMGEVSARDSAIMVLVIADIDRFKSVNDGHGHRSGDIVIRTVAQRMAATLAGADLIGRLGGEEFAVLASMASAGTVLASLTAFREQLARNPVLVDGVAIPVTISAGVAIRDGDEPFDRLYTEADTALYRAKDAGRNRIALSPRLERLCFEAAGHRSAPAAADAGQDRVERDPVRRKRAAG